MTRLAMLEDAPAHDEESRPCEDAKRKTESPDGQIGERVKVSPPRPLQIPRQVREACGLCADLLHVREPLLVGEDGVEGVGLEDAEGKDGGEAADNQIQSDQ